MTSSFTSGKICVTHIFGSRQTQKMCVTSSFRSGKICVTHIFGSRQTQKMCVTSNFNCDKICVTFSFRGDERVQINILESWKNMKFIKMMWRQKICVTWTEKICVTPQKALENGKTTSGQWVLNLPFRFTSENCHKMSQKY